ncbi:hypothetical protein [Streptomyces griseoloalbus]
MQTLQSATARASSASYERVRHRYRLDAAAHSGIPGHLPRT